jgi:hypothetical protein
LRSQSRSRRASRHSLVGFFACLSIGPSLREWQKEWV